MDLLWGQCALFQFIRMQDDLLDGHVRDLEAQFVADRFLVESLAAFQGAGGLGEAFWTQYCRCLRDTADGILEVRRLEVEPGRFGAGHLDLHAKVASIFKVGVSAVCHRVDRIGEIEWISALQDRIAVATQIRDDLQDLGEDLAADRYTFVGNALLDLAPGERLDAEERRERLREGLLRPGRSEPIWEALRREAQEAEARVPLTAPAPVRALVRSLGESPDVLAETLHEHRVRWIFGDALVQRARALHPGGSGE